MQNDKSTDVPSGSKKHNGGSTETPHQITRLLKRAIENEPISKTNVSSEFSDENISESENNNVEHKKAVEEVIEKDPSTDRSASMEERRVSAQMRNSFRQLTSEEDASPVKLSFKSIIGGDLLVTSWFRRQYPIFFFIILAILVIVINGYACEQQMIHLSRLQDTLRDSRFKAITIMTQYKDRIRPSEIEERVRDTALKYPHVPVYRFDVNGETGMSNGKEDSR